MTTSERIADFLAGEAYAVVGASADRSKYGNKVLRCYLQHGREAYAVNPRAEQIEGARSFPDLASLVEGVGPIGGLSIVTPPAITEGLVEEAARVGIPRLWMQIGAESGLAVRRARELGLACIAGGPCLLVALGFRDR
jgi:predicted CoA-binding protein